MMSPFLIPLVIIGAKYDVFQVSNLLLLFIQYSMIILILYVDDNITDFLGF